MKQLRVSVIIPVFNEQDSITRVLGDLPKHLIHEIIVVDNRLGVTMTKIIKIT